MDTKRPLIIGVNDEQSLAQQGPAPKIILTGIGEETVVEAPEPEAPAEGATAEPERKPLFIDPDMVKALTPEFQNYACASCDKLQAMWAFLPSDRGPDPDPIPICSLCFLYKHPWGRRREKELKEFIAMIQRDGKVTYEADPDGNLVRPKNADAVMFSIYQGSRIAAVQQRMLAQTGVVRGGR